MTEAQAARLLLMTSYNWSERRVIKMIQSMPHIPSRTDQASTYRGV